LQGYYKEAGLNVTFVSPESDAYEKTPRKKVESGEATFGICPSETVISCHSVASGCTGSGLVAVAALLQTQTSAIVTLKSSGITSPKMLDGKNYASYQGRFEMDIVRQLVISDGGAGDVKEVLPGQHGLGIFNTMLAEPDTYDATWVFMPWEGVIARQRGVELNAFSLEGIPYGYTPVMVCRPDVLAAERASLAAFLRASAQGYKDAVANQAAATEILIAQARASAAAPSDPSPAPCARRPTAPRRYLRRRACGAGSARRHRAHPRHGGGERGGAGAGVPHALGRVGRDGARALGGLHAVALRERCGPGTRSALHCRRRHDACVGVCMSKTVCITNDLFAMQNEPKTEPGRTRSGRALTAAASCAAAGLIKARDGTALPAPDAAKLFTLELLA